MYGKHIPNQKFDSRKISVLREIQKNLNKIIHIKDVEDIFLHNNNAEK